MEERYGHRTSGMFGHSHVTGGYPGGQAEFVRVPFADVNCLCIPESLDDDKAVLLADVATTGFHACEMADVGDDLHRNVAVWGCGPVGLMAVMWAKARGATKVVAIDCVPYRLEMARRMGADVAVNFKEIKDVAAHVRDCFPPLGADACIEAVGFRYAKSWTHAVERTMALETDAIDTIDECVKACRKGGSISVVGDYMGSCNHFPIGAVMEKGLTLRSGQCHVQKYWKSLAALLARKEVDPSPIVSHKLPLSEAPRAYKLFDTKEDEAIKILLVP
jgi:threonine dehydrogenase-like Zn-dependent dehydrogenase